MEEKVLDTQQIVDEWLEAATGGTRSNARLEVRVRAVDEDGADDEGNDMSPGIIICPRCLHTLRFCTCVKR